jgi:hypothetical protein
VQSPSRRGKRRAKEGNCANGGAVFPETSGANKKSSSETVIRVRRASKPTVTESVFLLRSTAFLVMPYQHSCS